ncbi:MAG: endo-1,4-beta-xylanase [Sphingobium sp.]
MTNGESAPSGHNPSPARRPGHRFGAAVRPDQLVEEGPLLSVIRQCDILVPEYHGQWSAVEWRRGDPWYGNYDAIVDFARDHGQMVRGHSLIWEQMTPDWARAEMVDKRDWKTVERHFASLLPRYSGRIAEWIVVNEMIDTEEGDQGIRRTSFQRAYGNDYVARALETARALDPEARLMINEYGVCHDNRTEEDRRTALLRLVERLKGRGVPLDMVGIQGHLELEKGLASQRRMADFLRDLADMGVGLALTEVDVLEKDRSLSLAERDGQVADAIGWLLDIAQQEPAMTSMVTWGLSDRHSWLQERSETTQAALACTPPDCANLNRGLPFDGEMRPKSLHTVLASAMPSLHLQA